MCQSCALRLRGVQRKTSVPYVRPACYNSPCFMLALTKFGQNYVSEISPTLRYCWLGRTKVESKDQFDLINNFDCLFMHCIDLRITPVSCL